VGFGAGQVVSGVEIRPYHGDFEVVAALARRVWIAAYGGQAWFPLWDAAFFRWQFGGGNAALSMVAWDGDKLVGSILSMPHTLRMGSSVLPVAVSSWVTVDPDYRNRPIVMRLMEASRRRHREQGLALSLGLVSGDRDSLAHRFWTQYEKAYPHNLRFLFGFGVWTKLLAPQAVARAGLPGWQRPTALLLAPLLRASPFGADPAVRPYGSADLEACRRMLDRASARHDWALVWSPQRLAHQLDHPAARTLMLERGGRVRAMVNYHCLSFQREHTLRAALIDLWADDGANLAQRVRLLGHVCEDMRERNIEIVLAPRCAMMPAAAFAANLFLPAPGEAHMVAMFPQPGIALAPPKSWSLLMR
jgi:GNAT superfamily N-acetyltransferase